MKAYLDNLDWKSFFWIFFQKNFKKVYFLDQNKKSSFLKKILSLKGIKLEEVLFFTGSIKTDEGETVYLKANEKNIEFSLILSEKIISSSRLLNELNKKYGNNTFKLYFSKFFQANLFYWILRIYTVKSLENSKNFSLYLKAPNFIDKKYISDFFPEINFIFYNSYVNQKFSFLIEIAKDLFTKYKYYFINLFCKNYTEYKNGDKHGSLVSIQEESIRIDQSIRNQFHWTDLSESKRKYPIHVISLNNKASPIKENIDELSKNKIYVNQSGIFSYALKKQKSNPHINQLRGRVTELFFEILKNGFDIKSQYLAKAIFLINRSIEIASTCLLLNAKIYLIKESYFHYSDAIQLLSKKIGVKTITYQYSNLGMKSPLMMSFSDVFLTFSSSYNTLFKHGSFGPKIIKPIGYVNDGIKYKIEKRIKKLKKIISKLNVDFVISFFDEANENSKWLLIHQEDYWDNIKLLAKKIIHDKKLAVIIKTQFNKNRISKIFINEPLINEAMKTGRLIEIFEGGARNDVYPLEAASCADICINHKIGATAALESISINKRCLLINPYNYKTIHDEIYNKKNILFSTLEEAIDAIDDYRQDNKSAIKNDLGDWSEIKSYFLEEIELKGIDAINKEVEESLRIS